VTVSVFPESDAEKLTLPPVWSVTVTAVAAGPFSCESEIVAGFHVEYSGMTFAVFFLAEYANMILISTVSALLFWGGWLSPFDFAFIREAGEPVAWLAAPGIWWLAAKTGFFMFAFLWVRATFPRFRYDQIMRLGWKVFIPITLIWIAVVGVAMMEPIAHWPVLRVWFGK